MDTPPRVFVYEFISGGGWEQPELPAGLADEGTAMAAGLLADFRRWGGVRTVTTLDRRLAAAGRRPPADDVRIVSPGDYLAAFDALLAISDAALIIAPETGGLLADLSRRALDRGVLLLGSSPDAAALAADKPACCRLWAEAGLPTPPFRQAPPQPAAAPSAAVEADVLGYPLVAKPPDGVGCEGVYLVSHRDQLDAALAAIEHVAPDKPILLQKYAAGQHASVSLLVAGARSLPLSLNGQAIHPGRPFAYEGGTVPLEHPARGRAFEVAQAAARLIPGLQGYVGVDLVLDGGEAWLIEINPRLTTSYVGLRRVLQMNLAPAIWEAGCEGTLPAEAPLMGQARFVKGRLSELLEAV